MSSQRLYCCVCLHTRHGVADEAETIINGCAVCLEHMGHVAGGKLRDAISLVEEEEARAG